MCGLDYGGLQVPLDRAGAVAVTAAAGIVIGAYGLLRCVKADMQTLVPASMHNQKAGYDQKKLSDVLSTDETNKAMTSLAITAARVRTDTNLEALRNEPIAMQSKDLLAFSLIPSFHVQARDVVGDDSALG